MSGAGGATAGRVLVVGGGLAGMTAAYYVAEWGTEVTLLDSAPHVGGAFLLLDHTFTTDSCGLCLALPHQPSTCPTIATRDHPRIATLTETTLVALEGVPGRFRATLRHAPRSVDPDRCDACGACAAVCPVLRRGAEPGRGSRWGRFLGEDILRQKAIYPPPPRAEPTVYAIDRDACIADRVDPGCRACVAACPRDAIDLEARGWEEEIEVGAVVLAPGFTPFDAAQAYEYGWGRCENVVTSLELERMLNRSGPTKGRILRPSDGRVPQRIAFVHCVGSRSEALGRPYCSSSCCMITAKQVGLSKEVVPEAEVTVFTMDVRTAGKGYERYVQRVEALPGVTYRRGRPAAVHALPHSKDLRLLTPEGEETVDLLVLAVGMGPAEGARALAEAAGVAVDEHGFVLSGQEGLGSTSRPGVFSAGSSVAPADVPETVTQAAASAALAAQVLAPSHEVEERVQDGGASDPRCTRHAERDDIGLRHREAARGRRDPPLRSGDCAAAPAVTDAPRRERVDAMRSAEDAPPPSDADIHAGAREVRLRDRPPQLGVFLCTCGGNLEGALDVAALAAAIEGLRGVSHVERVAEACQPAGLRTIKRVAEEHALNRVVVAGCSPHLYADRFDDLMAGLELPPRMLGRANIREGAAWPHGDDTTAATDVARGEIAMAVAALRGTSDFPFSLLEPGAAAERAPGRRVLVLGGGLAGMTAALTLAELGVDCDLVEREDRLGGNLWEARQTLEGLDAQALLRRTVKRVEQCGGIRLLTEAQLVAWSGTQGTFQAQLAVGDARWAERYGALIVATGAEAATTGEYLYGQHPQVVTQRELEGMIADATEPSGVGARSVVMIQCVGSRDDEHPYCSRVCCGHAIRNALDLKAIDPGIEISVLFRDIRTMGTDELFYREARRAGIRFLRYEPPGKPDVEARGDRLRVTVHDTLYDETLTLEADLLVLSTGIAPAPGNRPLAALLGVELDEDGFFAELHPKLRPTDLPTPGLFLCGMAYGPRFIAESVGQARAAAMRAALGVVQPPEPRREAVAVEPKLCSFCGLCVTTCPYGARVLDEEERVARVIDVLCQGCGACVAVCPNGASRQPAFRPARALAVVDAALT